VLLLVQLYWMEYSLLVVLIDWLFVFVFFEKVLVYLDHKHLHHHRHQDFQLLNFEYLDHVEMMFRILDVVEMEYILYSHCFHSMNFHQ
jgi:hypothetical protein